MAVPTYEELLAHCNVDSSLMGQTFSDDHLMEFSSQLEKWESLALSLRLPSTEIENIKGAGDIEMQRYKLLKCWKQRCGSMATYKALVKALLQTSRTDLAEKVIAFQKSLKESPPSPSETNLATLTSPASSCGTEDMSPSVTMSPSLLATPSKHEQTVHQVISTLKKLEKEFYDLVIHIEDTLENSKISLKTITRRFRMLPQSVRRQHETDKNYKEIRKSVLNSKTTKELFDNLTELKHWNYMNPDTLIHIIQDIKIYEIHTKIETYKSKLIAFKTDTKLRELIGISFPVPDYCMELTMEVEGWEDKTIQEVENEAVNIVRRAAYSGSPHIKLGWKGVMPGSIKVTFILMESVKIIPEKLLEGNGVVNVQIDEDIFHNEDFTKAASSNKEVPSQLWGRSRATSIYNAAGGRDILILAPNLSFPHPEAVARRPGQLTEEDKLKLQSQGVTIDCHNELEIMNTRYELDKRYKIVESKRLSSRQKVIESIAYLLNTTQNDGVALHYIGAGRRGTGDWCFEDGFITFRDIAQLYLRASHNFKGRVLTIVSDCSYSGCWVRDCTEFLDEQGVQPCGHKAREKGILIKVLTSCKSNEIPSEYCYSVSGIDNDKDIGVVNFWLSKQLLETQTTASFDSSHLNCDSKTIDEPCTLPPDLTWKYKYS